MRKTLTMLALTGALAGGLVGCSGKGEKLDTQKRQTAEVSAIQKKPFFNRELMQRWVTDSGSFINTPTWQAYRLLPISYEYNYKDGRRINGVWCGIEGSTGASLDLTKPDSSLDTEISLDLENYSEMTVGGRLPTGYSLVTVRGFGRKPTSRELNRIVNAFELYVSRYGNRIQLGLTKEEMVTLRNAVNQLKGEITR